MKGKAKKRKEGALREIEGYKFKKFKKISSKNFLPFLISSFHLLHIFIFQFPLLSFSAHGRMSMEKNAVGKEISWTTWGEAQ